MRGKFVVLRLISSQGSPWPPQSLFHSEISSQKTDTRTIPNQPNTTTTEEASIKKKCGRKRKSGKAPIHDKYKIDNVLRKIQTHCISSIIILANKILKIKGYKFQFCDIDYNFKKNVSSQFIESLQNKKLYEILFQKPNGHYKNISEYYNKEKYEIVKNEEIFNTLLNLEYKQYYQEIYNIDRKELDLNKYGLNTKIKTNELDMFCSLLTKQKDDYKYINNLKQVAKSISKRQFVVSNESSFPTFWEDKEEYPIYW